MESRTVYISTTSPLSLKIRNFKIEFPWHYQAAKCYDKTNNNAIFTRYAEACDYVNQIKDIIENIDSFSFYKALTELYMVCHNIEKYNELCITHGWDELVISIDEYTYEGERSSLYEHLVSKMSSIEWKETTTLEKLYSS